MKVDFHTHTHHSYDSLMKPAKILKLAKERGLDAIVISDHDTIKGGLEAQRIRKDSDVEVIVAAEVATSAGDIIGLFLKEEIAAREVDAVLDEIKAQGGKTILVHPYVAHELDKIDYSKIDFIEVNNSRLNKYLNQKAFELAVKHNIPMVSGSDAHMYNEIANCYTEIDNLNSLTPTSQTYRPSSRCNKTKSQYIKAYKRKSLSLFLTVTIMYLKKTIGVKGRLLS